MSHRVPPPYLQDLVQLVRQHSLCCNDDGGGEGGGDQLGYWLDIFAVT